MHKAVLHRIIAVIAYLINQALHTCRYITTVLESELELLRGQFCFCATRF